MFFLTSSIKKPHPYSRGKYKTLKLKNLPTFTIIVNCIKLLSRQAGGQTKTSHKVHGLDCSQLWLQLTASNLHFNGTVIAWSIYTNFTGRGMNGFGTILWTPVTNRMWSEPPREWTGGFAKQCCNKCRSWNYISTRLQLLVPCEGKFTCCRPRQLC